MWHFFRGYVILRLEGVYLERFLNGLRQAHIPVWGIRRREDRALELRIYRRDLVRLLPLRRRCRCRLNVEKRCGLPAWWHILGARRWMFFAAAVLLALVCFCSGRVWYIEVEGCRNMDREVLLQTLADHGIGIGRPVKKLPLSDIGRRVGALYDEIAFLGLQCDGVFLKVTVREAEGEKDHLEYNVPCDIVAEKSGIVTRLTVYRGTALVKTGERVEAGQVLISGTVVARDDSLSYRTHAMGDIYIARAYYGEARAPQARVEERETGCTAPYAAVLWKEKLLVERESPFTRSLLEQQTDRGRWKLFAPVEFLQGEYRELEETQIPLEPWEQEEQALALAQQQALLQVPRTAGILMLSSHVARKEGILWGICTVTAEERIGIQREMEP